jgi:hypothetical protein
MRHGKSAATCALPKPVRDQATALIAWWSEARAADPRPGQQGAKEGGLPRMTRGSDTSGVQIDSCPANVMPSWTTGLAVTSPRGAPTILRRRATALLNARKPYLAERLHGEWRLHSLSTLHSKPPAACAGPFTGTQRMPRPEGRGGIFWIDRTQCPANPKRKVHDKNAPPGRAG